MPSASVNGVRIAYEERGEGLRLVLVHGFGLAGRFWEPQAERLATRYRVITYDARGHGD